MTLPQAAPSLDVLHLSHINDEAEVKPHDFTYATKNKKTATALAKALKNFSYYGAIIDAQDDSGEWLVDVQIPCCPCHFDRVHEAVQDIANKHHAAFIGCGQYSGATPPEVVIAILH